MNLFRSDKAERVLSENNYARLSRMTLDSWAANGGVATDADREAYLAAWSQPGALTGGLNYYRASPLHPPRPMERAACVPEFDPRNFTCASRHWSSGASATKRCCRAIWTDSRLMSQICGCAESRMRRTGSCTSDRRS